MAATLQHKHHFTVSTQQRYRDLVERTGFVCALGEGMGTEPIPGLRGAELPADDPVRGEWDLVVLSPHFSAALLARDLSEDADIEPGSDADQERMFEYALTYDRDVVTRAAHELMLRVAPRVVDAATVGRRSWPVSDRGAAAGRHPCSRPATSCCAARWRPAPTASPSPT